MRGALRVTLIAAGTALLACGCGQKGPLYLPDKGGKVVTSTPGATPAPPAPPAQPATPATATPKPGDKDQDQDQQPKP
jgi:predicted small lipoprotein YifL